MVKFVQLYLSIIRSHCMIWLYTLDMATHVGMAEALTIRRRVLDNTARRMEWRKANG